MTMQETHLDPLEGRYNVALEELDPWLAPVDLTRFEALDDDERMRIIIRVLCGLVAMEESAPLPPDEGSAVSPTPGPNRQLPFLGIEGPAAEQKRHRPRGWSTALLPHLGREQEF